MSEICTTCLSHDRELQPLGSMQFIYDLLMDNDGYDIPSMKICWECHAYLQHATKFRRRALEAKEFLLKLNFELKSNAGIIRSMPPLSSLSTLEKFNLTDFIENDPLSIVKEEIIEDELNGIDTETMDTEEDNKNAKPTILNYKLPVAKDTAIKKTTPFVLQKVVAKTTDKPIKQYKTKKIKAKEIKSESSFFRRGVFKVSKVQYEMELKRLLSEADSRLAAVKHNAVVQSNFREAKDKTDVLSDEEIYEHFTRLANDPLIQVEVLDARQVLKQRNILRTHEQYRDSQFKCKHCILGFTDQEKVDEHMKTKHLLKPSPETIRCDVCMCHIHRGMYQFHVARHHVLYRCAKCGFTVYNGNLDSHVLTHRVNKDGEMAYASIQPKIKLEQTQCTVCNRTISVRNLRKHMEVHKKHNADTKGSKERKKNNDIVEKDPLELSD